MQARYLNIADDLEARIIAGEWAPGARIPSAAALAQRYEAGKPIIAEAVAELELRGLVAARHRSGTYVLPAGEQHRIDLGTTVRRNELGYIFAKPAGHWEPAGTPGRGWIACPEEVAGYLGIATGTRVFARWRAVGPGGRAVQSTTSYYPADIVGGTAIEAADTGPGGVLDRIEQDLGHGPLSFEAEMTARLPTEAEATTLGVSARLPVLVTTRIATDPSGRVVAVDVVVVEARRFSAHWSITRDDSARWPVPPATARNIPRPN